MGVAAYYLTHEENMRQSFSQPSRNVRRTLPDGTTIDYVMNDVVDCIMISPPARGTQRAVGKKMTWDKLPPFEEGTSTIDLSQMTVDPDVEGGYYCTVSVINGMDENGKMLPAEFSVKVGTGEDDAEYSGWSIEQGVRQMDGGYRVDGKSATLLFGADVEGDCEIIAQDGKTTLKKKVSVRTDFYLLCSDDRYVRYNDFEKIIASATAFASYLSGDLAPIQDIYTTTVSRHTTFEYRYGTMTGPIITWLWAGVRSTPRDENDVCVWAAWSQEWTKGYCYTDTTTTDDPEVTPGVEYSESTFTLDWGTRQLSGVAGVSGDPWSTVPPAPEPIGSGTVSTDHGTTVNTTTRAVYRDAPPSTSIMLEDYEYSFDFEADSIAWAGTQHIFYDVTTKDNKYFYIVTNNRYGNTLNRKYVLFDLRKEEATVLDSNNNVAGEATVYYDQLYYRG
jgi:hypothetical protein